MPINKKGEFIPTVKQRAKGAPVIKFSKPYSSPDAPKTFKVDVTMYEWTGIEYKQHTIKGVSEGVARKITLAIKQEVATARSEATMMKRTQESLNTYFTREYGKSAVLFENLASESGLAQIFMSGLKGKLRPHAQADFEELTKLISLISDDRAAVDAFYKKAKKQFNILGSKYHLFKRNNRKVDADDTPDAFTTSDVLELEKALHELVEMARDYLNVGESYRVPKVKLQNTASLRKFM